MGKSKESKTINRQAENEYNRFGNQSDALYNMIMKGYQGSDDSALRNETLGGYRDLIGNSDYSKYLGDIDLDPNELNRLRGGGVFEEFSKTGGLSDQDISNIRTRGSGTVKSLYDNLRDTYQRQNVTQGGYSPGFDSRAAKLAREGSRAMDEATLGAELGITDTRNRGRMWGAEGLSGSERGIQDIYGRNAGLRLGAAEAGNRNRLAGLGGMSSMYSQTPGRENMFLQYLLQSLGLGAQGRQSNLNSRMGYNPNQNFMDKYLMPLIGAGGSVAGGLASGGAFGGSQGYQPFDFMNDEDYSWLYGGS